MNNKTDKVRKNGEANGDSSTVVRDITDRKQTESALNGNERWFRALVENLSEAIALLGPDGRLLYASPAASRINGYSMQEFMGRNAFEIIHPDDHLHVEQYFRQIMQTPGTSTEIQFRLKHSDGSWRWIDAVATNRLDDPAIGAIVVNYRDITGRKQTELALLESATQHRAILLTSMDGFWRGDLQGRLLEVNEAYCRMSGYSEKELLAMNVADIEAVETSTDIATHIKRILEQGEHRFESMHRRKDGSTYSVEISAQYKSLEGGQMVAFLRDITERKQAEEEMRDNERKLLEQKTALEQKNAALRELLEQIGAEKSRIHDNIVANMEDVVMPLLAKLQLKGVSRKYVELLEHHLRDLTAPYARQMVTGKTRRLTPRETEICSMIKSGLPSKDISEMLGVSCQTVQRHRRNIRQRLGLTGKKQNLTSFLANS